MSKSSSRCARSSPARCPTSRCMAAAPRPGCRRASTRPRRRRSASRPEGRRGRGDAMGVIYAARSVALGKWGADVGLSKHIYKIGYGEEPVKKLIEAGWAGEHHSALVAQQEGEGLSEEEVISRHAPNEKHNGSALFSWLKRGARVFH